MRRPASERVRGRAQGSRRSAALFVSALTPPVPVLILVPRPVARSVSDAASRQDERTQRRSEGSGRAAARPTPDRQASARFGGLLPATTSSSFDAVCRPSQIRVCKGPSSVVCSAELARRSKARSLSSAPVSLGSQRSCRVSKGLQEGWLAVSGCRAEQRSTDQLMLSPPAHAEAAAARQPAGGPPPPAHAEAAAARPPPTDRWMEDGPRGGRRQRPSSAQRQRQAGSSSSPGRKTGITAGQLDGSGDNWPTINQRQPSRAPRLSSSAHQPCAGSVDAPQPVALRRCCVKEADRPPRPWTSKTGRHHH